MEKLSSSSPLLRLLHLLSILLLVLFFPMLSLSFLSLSPFFYLFKLSVVPFSSSLFMFICFLFSLAFFFFLSLSSLSFCLPGHGLVKTSSALCLFSFISLEVFRLSPLSLPLYLCASSPLSFSFYITFPPSRSPCYLLSPFVLLLFLPFLPLFPYLFIPVFPALSLSLHLFYLALSVPLCGWLLSGDLITESLLLHDYRVIILWSCLCPNL